MARKALRTACFFTQSAATRFIASIFPFLNRVLPKRAFEGLEPYMAKVLSTVLRGLDPSNGVRLLGRLERGGNKPFEALGQCTHTREGNIGTARRRCMVYLLAQCGEGLARLDSKVRIHEFS